MKTPDILFIIPPFHRRSGGGRFFPLGIGYIISDIEEYNYTWDAVNCSELINSFFTEDLRGLECSLKKILPQYEPLLIGIGPCVTTQIRALKVIASVCNELFPKIPVFAGGPLTAIEGQEWLFYDELNIKYMIKGDGEKAVADAVRVLKEKGSIENSKYVSCRDRSFVNCVEDINSLKFPYREYLSVDEFSVRRQHAGRNTAAMITSRGCPYSCFYCVSGNMKNGTIRYRKRSNENIVREMKRLQNSGFNDIIFYDDCFFASPHTVNKEVENFCDCLSEENIGVTWQMEMRPDVFCALSDGSIDNLKAYGCREISLGVEKLSKSGLAFLGKSGIQDNFQEKIHDFKRKTEIRIAATFILGGGDETAQGIRDEIDLIKKWGIDFAHFNPLFVYPGTPLYAEVFGNDNRAWAYRVLGDDLPWGEIVYENQDLTREDLLDLIDYAYHKFYENTKYAGEQMVQDRFNLRRS